MSMPIIKSGWLLRLSTVLKRWKKNYFVLYADGNLSYYEDDSRREKHGNVNLTFNGLLLKTALECQQEPAEGKTIGCLMTIVCKNGEEVTVCGENNDDCLAWKMMIEQPITARTRGYQPRPLPGQYPHAIPQQYPPPTYTAGQQSYCVPNQGQPPVYNYPNYGPVQVMYTMDGRPYYVHPNTQVVHVIRDNDPYYYRGSGLGLGMAGGLMLGAALWTPFLFF